MKAFGSIDTLLPRASAVLTHLRLAALAVVTGALVAGCGAGSVQTAANPVTPPSSNTQSYTGPAPASADVQAFVVNFWNNVKTTDSCGACHIQGNQSPMFARSDDVNLAYQRGADGRRPRATRPARRSSPRSAAATTAGSPARRPAPTR